MKKETQYLGFGLSDAVFGFFSAILDVFAEIEIDEFKCQFDSGVGSFVDLSVEES